MYKPLHNFVLIRPQESQASLPSGIILATPTSNNQAKVVAIGPKVQELHVEDIVIYDLSATRKLGEYLLIAEENVLCIVA